MTCFPGAQWRAAGVLVYEFDEHGEMKLLLARQDHREKGAASKHRAWNILGELFSAAPGQDLMFFTAY